MTPTRTHPIYEPGIVWEARFLRRYHTFFRDVENARQIMENPELRQDLPVPIPHRENTLLAPRASRNPADNRPILQDRYDHGNVVEEPSSFGGDGAGAFTRSLGTLEAFAIVISIVIGSGVFTSPGSIDTNVPSPGAALLVWLVGGVLAWTGAVTLAELGTAIPGEGGVQPYLKYIYGDIFGFLAAWTWVVAVYVDALFSLCSSHHLHGWVPLLCGRWAGGLRDHPFVRENHISWSLTWTHVGPVLTRVHIGCLLPLLFSASSLSKAFTLLWVLQQRVAPLSTSFYPF